MVRDGGKVLFDSGPHKQWTIADDQSVVHPAQFGQPHPVGDGRPK
jgi:hypothetical protein